MATKKTNELGTAGTINKTTTKTTTAKKTGRNEETQVPGTTGDVIKVEVEKKDWMGHQEELASFTTAASINRIEVTKPGYYKPDLVDFRLGAIYMQKWAGSSNGAWRETLLDEECYDMSMGHCEFMSIVSNVKRTKGEFYRIKFLNDEDVEMLGFKKTGAGVYELSNCRVVLDWSTKFNVKVLVDDELIYRGKVLCLSEFKWVLCTLGILKDESRDRKFEQLGSEL
jgi:hypothetical protein